MIVNLDRFTTIDDVLNDILAEKNKPNKTGYIEVDYISEKLNAWFKRLYLNIIKKEQIKDDIQDIYMDYLRTLK